MDKLTDKQKARHYKKHLRDLVVAVQIHVWSVDGTMKHQPDSYQRGKRIAELSNKLELALDQARHFGLGESLKKKEASK